MYIIIAGGGFVGQGLTQRLLSNNHDVVVIDIERARCEEVYAKYGAVTIVGSATNLDTLESANVLSCDIAIAVMQDDADNLAFATLAKHYGVKQVIVQMNNPRYEDVYESIGVDTLVKRTDLLIDQIIVSVESPGLRKIIGVGDVEICILHVPENGKCAGFSVAKITSFMGFPKDVLLIAALPHDSNSFIIPKGDTVIGGKDRLFLCGLKANIKKAASIIGG